MAKEIKSCYKKREAMKNEISGDLIGIVSFLLIVYLECDDQQHAFSQQSLNSKAERSTAKLASSSMKHTNVARASRQGKGLSINDISIGGISSIIQVGRTR